MFVYAVTEQISGFFSSSRVQNVEQTPRAVHGDKDQGVVARVLSSRRTQLLECLQPEKELLSLMEDAPSPIHPTDPRNDQ